MTLRKRLATVAVAFTVTLTGLVPAQAFQMPAAPLSAPVTAGQATEVQYSPWERRRMERRAERRFDRRAERRFDRRMDRRAGWYNGHRGYRDRRAGYRYHNGYWYPLAAFAAGAIIGGAINQGSPRVSSSSAHVRWCSERYRTYRASDNTYVPRAGVRAYCNSPY